VSITYADLREKLVEVARHKSEWAGLPLPLPDLDLVVEKNYPYQFGAFNKEPYAGDDAVEVVNRWWSTRMRAHAVLYKDKAGKRGMFYEPWNQGMMLINTLMATTAWSVEVEAKAREKLRSLVTDAAYESYTLADAFIESSKRSGVFYVFRRLRPTVAMKAGADGQMKVLCALCAHTVGYYASSWAGVLCPTDEVVSHLAYMRGDEAKFWRMCNQHPAHTPQSGL
jgi:hypothetical protein